VLRGHDRDPGRKVAASGENSLTISDSNGETVDVKIDPATHLIASESYKQLQPAGAASAITVTLSDYKPVDGVKVPFKLTLAQGDKQVATAIVSEYLFNTGIKPEDLAKKP